jgi:hypothetical protein
MPFFFFTPDFLREEPAYFYTRILVGPGSFLTPYFVEKHGITHVINCAHDDFSPVWWRTRFPDRYKLIEAVDNLTVNILDWYPEFETTLQRYLREGDGVVYVHCQAGINRSAFLTLAYTVKNLGVDMDELIVSVSRQRPCILKNPVFMNQVREFVNGRLQDSQDTRTQHVRFNDRYARFFTPGNYTGSQGYEDQTGCPSSGSGQPANGNITPLFYE